MSVLQGGSVSRANSTFWQCNYGPRICSRGLSGAGRLLLIVQKGNLSLSPAPFALYSPRNSPDKLQERGLAWWHWLFLCLCPFQGNRVGGTGRCWPVGRDNVWVQRSWRYCISVPGHPTFAITWFCGHNTLMDGKMLKAFPVLLHILAVLCPRSHYSVVSCWSTLCLIPNKEEQFCGIFTWNLVSTNTVMIWDMNIWAWYLHFD